MQFLLAHWCEELGPHMAGCSAQEASGLVASLQWAGKRQALSLKTGSRQHQCPNVSTSYLKHLPSMSISPCGFPFAYWLSGGGGIFLQYQQVAQAPFKLLSLNWGLEHVGLCICLLRAGYLFSIAFWLSRVKALLVFKQDIPGACPPRIRSPIGGSDPLVLSETSALCGYPPICGSPVWGYESWKYCVFIPPTNLIVAPFLYI